MRPSCALRIAEVGVGYRIVSLYFDRPLVAGYRVFVLSQELVRQAEIISRFEVIGRDTQC